MINSRMDQFIVRYLNTLTLAMICLIEPKKNMKILAIG